MKSLSSTCSDNHWIIRVIFPANMTENAVLSPFCWVFHWIIKSKVDHNVAHRTDVSVSYNSLWETLKCSGNVFSLTDPVESQYRLVISMLVIVQPAHRSIQPQVSQKMRIWNVCEAIKWDYWSGQSSSASRQRPVHKHKLHIPPQRH